MPNLHDSSLEPDKRIVALIMIGWLAYRSPKIDILWSQSIGPTILIQFFWSKWDLARLLDWAIWLASAEAAQASEHTLLPCVHLDFSHLHPRPSFTTTKPRPPHPTLVTSKRTDFDPTKIRLSCQPLFNFEGRDRGGRRDLRTFGPTACATEGPGAGHHKKHGKARIGELVFRRD